MGSIRVMIVDDSLFSRAYLSDALVQFGCEVVGETNGIDSLIELYDQCKPDIVTMDIAMPGADGFACSKALLAHDASVKIILVSSMKDEETENEAKRTGISGYVEKPVDNEILNRVITNVLAPDEVFNKLQTTGIDFFKEALSQTVTRVTKTSAIFSNEETRINQYVSQGITAVIGIIGRYSGSMIIDLSEKTAEKLTEIGLKRNPKYRDEILAMAAEFANTVAGNGCSMINKRDKSYGLKVSPPSVFFGAPTAMICPNMQVSNVKIDTAFGSIYLSIGFKKGSVLWM